ncbi:IPT/TIG domain-containing protein [Nitrospira defluvii]|nr:IPT/TIG domain-containing protein [Nitrospira defluvii]
MDSRHTKNQYIKKVILCLVIFSLFFTLSVNAAPAEFFYDAQGRLIAEKDETGKMAVYTYDAVGNLIAIDTFTPAAGGIGILLILPESGVIGTEVQIEGFGFSTIPSENVVTFNGTTAVVSSSTPDFVTVTVPTGATTGPVAITNTNGTAMSLNPFTVLETPTVLALDPNRVAQGTTNVMVISGVNLSNVTGISFSSGSLTATFLSAPTSDSIQLSLNVDVSTLPGEYSFILNTPTGTIPSGLVTVSVLPAEPAFNTILKGITVFLPGPDSIAPSGSALSAALGPSVFFPPPDSIAPSGPALSATPGPSIFFPSPDAIAPSGSSITIAPPESVLMP